MIFTSQTRFREAFYKENMITAIVRRLVTDNEELQGYSANAIFKVSSFSACVKRRSACNTCQM